MDSITDKMSKLDTSSHCPNTFYESFNKLVKFVKYLRNYQIYNAELECTKALAGPFSTGGLLIVLLEPLQNHPWEKGVDAVISTCRTLSCLKEGLQIGSDGVLSLVNHVSLVDQRALMSKEQNMKISAYQREILYDFVVEAIDAKKPDVVLCMGNVCHVPLSYNNLTFTS